MVVAGDGRCDACGKPLDWVSTDQKWWCNSCLSFVAGDPPAEGTAPSATPTAQSEADHRLEWWRTFVWPIGAVCLIVTGALMWEFGLETAGKAVLVAAAAPLVVFGFVLAADW